MNSSLLKKVANLLLTGILLCSWLGSRACFAEDSAATNSTATSTTTGSSLASNPALEGLRTISKGFSEIAKAVSPSVVNIQVEQEVAANAFGRPYMPDGEGNEQLDPMGEEFFRFFFGPPLQREHPSRKQAIIGQGSGFIIKNDSDISYIVTNDHVVKDASKIIVKLLDGRELDGKIVGLDSHSDLAVIKVTAGNLPIVQLGDSDNIEVGEWVVAIGNPFGLSNTLTAGIISAKGRNGVGINDYENFIQTDAAINPGNSGGPLVNLDGKVIGINTAIVSQHGGYMGIGFAIPINMAVNITDQLIKTGSVSRGYFGVSIQELTPELAKSFGLDASVHGILVTQVLPNSPAAKTGLKQGDVITELDGSPIKSPADFRNTIALAKLGSSHSIVVLRDNAKKTFKFNTSSLPEEKKVLAQADTEISNVDKLGIAVKAITPNIANKLGLKDAKGVLIVNVTRGSIADMAGMRPNMVIVEVNRKPIANVTEFLTTVEKNEGGALLFLIQGRNGIWYLTLKQS